MQLLCERGHATMIVKHGAADKAVPQSGRAADLGRNQTDASVGFGRCLTKQGFI